MTLRPSTYSLAGWQYQLCCVSSWKGIGAGLLAQGWAVWTLHSGQGYKRIVASYILTNTVTRMLQNAYLWQQHPSIYDVLQERPVTQHSLAPAIQGALTGIGYWWEGAVKGVLAVIATQIGPAPKLAVEESETPLKLLSACTRLWRIWQVVIEEKAQPSEQNLAKFTSSAQRNFRRYSHFLIRDGALASQAAQRALHRISQAFGELDDEGRLMEFLDWFGGVILALACRNHLA